jgi:hypothetical protein
MLFDKDEFDREFNNTRRLIYIVFIVILAGFICLTCGILGTGIALALKFW